MARREYQGAATPTTITGSITNSATSLTLTSSTGWPTGSFSFVIDPGLAGEEKVLATSRSGATVTITTRGYDGTTAASHNAGAVIYPVPSAIDFDEANAHTVATTGVHGITGAVVGTTDTQTLSAKTLTAPIINNPKISKAYTAKTAAYTFASGDENALFSMNNAATQQFNIPTDATFAFAVGTEIDVFWITGAGQPTIGATTPGTTTVISTGATSATPKLRVANSGATARKLAADSWIVFGDIA